MKNNDIVGQVHHSNGDGDFIVLENCGKRSDIASNEDYYKIEFLFSKGISFVAKSCILSGEVKDRQNYGIDVSQLQYSNNYGPFKIIYLFKDRNANGKVRVHARIQFIQTGTIKTVPLKSVKNGEIVDPKLQHKLF